MPNAAPEPLQRFRTTIDALIGRETALEARFGVAVSGGPDSMALLWLCKQAFPERTEAATVDHGLRKDARAEAEMVAGWCTANKVPHAILTPDEPITGSLQREARLARYALLEQWRADGGIDWLLTAHHADDQLETMLMRLNRSSGVGGLAGVRARNGAVLRPLLDWRRAELEAIVAENGIPFANDPSNEDSRFDRVTMRKHLRNVDWLDPAAASRSAAACADAEEALTWVVGGLADAHVRPEGQGLALDAWDFPREIQRRLILHMLATLDPAAEPPRGEAIDQAVVQLSCGKRLTIGKWLLSGGRRWKIVPAPPRSAR